MRVHQRSARRRVKWLGLKCAYDGITAPSLARLLVPLKPSHLGKNLKGNGKGHFCESWKPKAIQAGSHMKRPTTFSEASVFGGFLTALVSIFMLKLPDK